MARQDGTLALLREITDQGLRVSVWRTGGMWWASAPTAGLACQRESLADALAWLTTALAARTGKDGVA